MRRNNFDEFFFPVDQTLHIQQQKRKQDSEKNNNTYPDSINMDINSVLQKNPYSQSKELDEYGFRVNSFLPSQPTSDVQTSCQGFCLPDDIALYTSARGKDETFKPNKQTFDEFPYNSLPQQESFNTMTMNNNVTNGTESYKTNYSTSVFQQMLKYPDWLPIPYFENDRLYAKGSLYGKSIGWVDSEGSSWLLGGNYLVTAAHIRTQHGIWNQPTCATSAIVSNQPSIGVSFGRYDRSRTQKGNTFTKGILDLENRLEDLGIPIKNTRLASFDNTLDTDVDLFNLRKFRCNFLRTSNNADEGCTDIDFYFCEPKKLFSTINRKVETVFLSPASLFGSIPLGDKRMIYPGRKVYGLSINQVNGFSRTNNLLSPDGYIVKHSPLNSLRDVTFETANLKSEKGSSGGSVIDLITNRALGVISGSYLSNKVHAKLPERAFRYARASRQPSHFSKMGRRFFYTSQAGENIGEVKYIGCPDNYAAAGVVGSSVLGKGGEGNSSLQVISPNSEYETIPYPYAPSSAYSYPTSKQSVGNFGIVCLPFSPIYQFDQSLVSASGSIDTHLKPLQNIPFSRYIVDYLSDGAPYQNTISQQRFMMCPPKYFLEGVEVKVGKFDGIQRVRQIARLHCRRYNETSDSQTRSSRLPIGHNYTMNRIFTPLSCPDGYFVTGAYVRGGNFTNSIFFQCQRQS